MSLHRPVRWVAFTTLALLTAGATLLWHPAAADEKPKQDKEPAKSGVLFALPDDPKKTPDDLKALQGTWQAVSLEHNGEKSFAEAVKNFRVVFKDNAITFESDGHKREATFLLLTASRPKAIWLKAQPKDPVIRAIYELAGNRLTFCVDNDKGTTMPTEFAAKAESGLTLMILEREPPPKKVGDASDPKEKRYAFAFDKQPWPKVFDWLTEQTELPFIGENIPTGTFSFTPPAGKTYTLSEILDIINEALLADPDNNKALMVRRDRSFRVISADHKSDRVLFFRVNDLATMGKMEICRIQVQLKWASSEIVGLIVEKMLSPFGRALSFEETKTLVLTDVAGHLRPVVRLIADLDREAKKP